MGGLVGGLVSRLVSEFVRAPVRGLVGGLVGEPVGGSVDAWADQRVDPWVHRWVDPWADPWMDLWADQWVDPWADRGRTRKWTCGRNSYQTCARPTRLHDYARSTLVLHLHVAYVYLQAAQINKSYRQQITRGAPCCSTYMLPKYTYKLLK